MSDFDFDARLERLFSQTPRVLDPEGFARRLEHRLEREWTVRRLLIGAAGVIGATVTLSQTLGSHFLTRAEAVAGPTARALTKDVAAFDPQALLGDRMLWSGEALWTIAVLAGLAAAFMATRWAEAL